MVASPGESATQNLVIAKVNSSKIPRSEVPQSSLRFSSLSFFAQ